MVVGTAEKQTENYEWHLYPMCVPLCRFVCEQLKSCIGVSIYKFLIA